MLRRTFACAVPALVVAVLALVPFRDKAFTIDDTLFLKQAQHALVDPLHPTAVDVVWTNVRERMSAIMPSGPIGAWLLLWSAHAGGDERRAHAVILGCLLVGLLATVRLALRLGLDDRGARAAGLLVVATPAVLGMAATVMPDVPAFALGVLGLERLFAFREERRLHQAAASALCLGGAALARSHAILLLGVGALALLDDDELFGLARLRAGLARIAAAPRARFLPIVGGAIVFLVVARLVRDPVSSRGLADAAGHFVTLVPVDRNSVAFFDHWVVAVPFALPWLALRARRLPWRLLWQAVPIAFAFLATAGQAVWAWVALLAALGFVCLADVALDAARRRDRVQLVLCAWLLVALPCIVYVHMPSKYLVVSVPAAAILVARALADAPARRARFVLGGALAGGLAIGLLVVAADARQGDLERQAAGSLLRPMVERGERVWFAGHWGWQWYAERAGAPILTKATGDRSRDPQRGDLVVASQHSLAGDVLELWPRRHLVAVYGDDTPGGRVMSEHDCAGFFSNGWGYLPWFFGTGPLDRFDIWQLD